MGAAEGQVKDVAVRDRSVKWVASTRSSLRTTPWLREAQRGRGSWCGCVFTELQRIAEAEQRGQAPRLACPGPQ